MVLGLPERSIGRAVKTYVTNEKENTRTPFLRGILTRSLLDAGMPFREAFRLASVVRDELLNTTEITSGQIHERVSELLLVVLENAQTTGLVRDSTLNMIMLLGLNQRSL